MYLSATPPPPPPAIMRSFSVSVPAAVAFTLPVNDTITLYGVQYQRTGSITYTPVVPTPTPSPTPAPTPTPTPTPTVPLTIVGFRNAQRNWILPTDTVAAGATVYIDGTGFGATKGTVMVAGAAAAAINAWNDQEIQIVVPPVTTPGTTNPSAQMISVTNANNQSEGVMAFIIK